MFILGIDLSKAYFDVVLLNQQGEKQYGRFDNNASGFAKLLKWLKEQGVSQLRVCMEATNIYWEELTEYLYEKGYKVSVVNPARIKGHAMSQLRRSKTDKLDSDVIADFCRAHEDLRVWIPTSQEQRLLRNLVRQREDLLGMVTQQKNRLTDSRDLAVKARWQRLIKTFQDEIEAIEKQIEEHIALHPTLQKTFELLCSIKGFGLVTAAILMAEMPDLADYKDAAAAAADAGVTPSHHESGDTVRHKSKMSKIGKASIRGALFFPALTAIRYNKPIHAFAERLEKQGKLKMVIIVAVMRKLIHQAYGVLKNQTPFDPNYGIIEIPAT